MNIDIFPALSPTLKTMGLGWFFCFFVVGLWIGYLIWKNTTKDARTLEEQNQEALNEYEERRKAYVSIRESLDSDPNS